MEEKLPCSKCCKTGYIVCKPCHGSGKLGVGSNATNCRRCGGGSFFSGNGKVRCDRCQATGYVYVNKKK